MIVSQPGYQVTRGPGHQPVSHSSHKSLHMVPSLFLYRSHGTPEDKDQLMLLGEYKFVSKITIKYL